MATGVRTMVIRVGDGVMWYEQGRPSYVVGKVVDVKYGEVRCLEEGLDLSHAVSVELQHVRVRTPKLWSGDIVAISTPDGRLADDALQGVVQPVRLRDGWRWFHVAWEDGTKSYQRAEDLLRVVIGEQHEALREAATIAAN